MSVSNINLHEDVLPARRLARMKTLIDQLEQVIGQSAEQRAGFQRLRAELDAARRDLEPCQPT